MHRYDEIAKVLSEKYKQMEAQMQIARKILINKDAEIAELKKGSGKKKVTKKVTKKKVSKKGGKK